MKVIANGNSSVIVEIGLNEFANMLGFSSEYTAKEALNNAWAAPGREHKMDERMRMLSGLSNLPAYVGGLRTVVDQLEKELSQAEAIVESTEFVVISKKK